MKSISPYYLWKFLSKEDRRTVSCTEGDRKYIDYRLSLFLAAHDIKLKRIIISNDIETYINLDDVHYLKAHVIMEDIHGEEVVMDIKPYYSGDDDEWAMLMMDKKVDDLDIRFSLGVYKPEPLWIASVEGGKRTLLSGDRLYWDLMTQADIEPEEDNFYPDTYGGEYTKEELYDIRAEAFDPDYDVSESPYNIWKF